MAHGYNEDLFEGSRMTFGEHLEELRVSLIKALMAVAVGFVIGLYMGEWFMALIKAPLEEALADYQRKTAIAEVETSLAEQEAAGMNIPNKALAKLMAIEEGWVLKEIKVDPRSVVETFEKQVPGSSEMLPQAQILNPRHVNDLQGFAKAIVAGTEASGANPGQRLWSLLGEIDPPADDAEEKRSPAQQLLQQAAAGEELTGKQQEQLFAALNQVLQRKDFFEADAFSTVVSGSELLTEAVSNREKFGRYEMARLNIYLLAAAYPQVQPNTLDTLISVLEWVPVTGTSNTQIQTLGAQEAFLIYVKAAFILGLILSSPISFYYIWDFVAAGLYPHERRYVYVFMPMSIGLFIVGAALAFFVVFSYVLEFLFLFNEYIGAVPNIRISEWLNFALILPVGFGLAFQLPLLMLFMERIGIFTTNDYWSKWRISVLVICIVSMILTPADPMSMIIMAGSLTPLYFLGIKLCDWMPRSRNPFPEPVEV